MRGPSGPLLIIKYQSSNINEQIIIDLNNDYNTDDYEMDSSVCGKEKMLRGLFYKKI